eukprot:scpid91570/ scgid30001/ 
MASPGDKSLPGSPTGSVNKGPPGSPTRSGNNGPFGSPTRSGNESPLGSPTRTDRESPPGSSTGSSPKIPTKPSPSSTPSPSASWTDASKACAAFGTPPLLRTDFLARAAEAVADLEAFEAAFFSSPLRSPSPSASWEEAATAAVALDAYTGLSESAGDEAICKDVPKANAVDHLQHGDAAEVDSDSIKDEANFEYEDEAPESPKCENLDTSGEPFRRGVMSRSSQVPLLNTIFEDESVEDIYAFPLSKERRRGERHYAVPRALLGTEGSPPTYQDEPIYADPKKQKHNSPRPSRFKDEPIYADPMKQKHNSPRPSRFKDEPIYADPMKQKHNSPRPSRFKINERERQIASDEAPDPRPFEEIYAVPRPASDGTADKEQIYAVPRQTHDPSNARLRAARKRLPFAEPSSGEESHCKDPSSLPASQSKDPSSVPASQSKDASSLLARHSANPSVHQPPTANTTSPKRSPKSDQAHAQVKVKRPRYIKVTESILWHSTFFMMGFFIGFMVGLGIMLGSRPSRFPSAPDMALDTPTISPVAVANQFMQSAMARIFSPTNSTVPSS